jgi:hypothetical protein
LIRTPSGEQAISTLQIGDLVAAHSGQTPLFDNWFERASRARDEPAPPIAPEINITGGRLQLRYRLRSALAPILDRRTDDSTSVPTALAMASEIWS